MVRVTALPNDLHTIMGDCCSSNAGVKSKEECANGREYGEAKRVQCLAHIGNEKVDVFVNLTDKSSKSA